MENTFKGIIKHICFRASSEIGESNTTLALVPRRSQSDVNLDRLGHAGQLKQRTNNKGASLADEDGEFYTAIGRDGQEIVLRRYHGDLPDGVDPSNNEDRGFLQMAMSHLRSNSGNDEQQSTVFTNSPSSPSAKYHLGLKTPGVQKRSKYNTSPSTGGGADASTMAPDKSAAPTPPDDESLNAGFDLTPKHHIRSPIIEETESSIEAELLRSRGGDDHRGHYLHHHNQFNPPLSDRYITI